METMVTTVHFVVALLMIGLVLLQQGKGASMGASFGGGASNTVFGSSGSATFFGKMTALLAVIFFVSSLGLTLIARNNAQIDSGSILPIIEAEQPTQLEIISDVPALPIDGVGADDFSVPVDELQPVEQESSAIETDGVESAAPVTE